MAHPRKLIRQAFKDRLCTPDEAGKFPTRAKDRVHTSRIFPVGNDDLPCILIYGRDEKKYEYGPNSENSWLQREYHLVVDAMVKGGETVDDALDDMAERLEALLLDWAIPGFESADVVLSESDIDLVTEGVVRPIGTIGLTFIITYRTPWALRPERNTLAGAEADDAEEFADEPAPEPPPPPEPPVAWKDPRTRPHVTWELP